MSVTHVDFKTRQVIAKPVFQSVAKVLAEDMFSQFDYAIECIKARFGDKMPEHVLTGMYVQDFKGNKFDAYGFGNVHNSVHQYKSEGNWNRPMPFPADLRAIDAFLKKRSGKTAILGHKSDAFMWMDQRYQVGKSVLKLANKYNVKLRIYTISDLISHDDYLDLVVEGGHTVVMQMGFEQPETLAEGCQHINFNSEEIERLVSPGAPSLKRRRLAFDKLAGLGVDVKSAQTNVKDLTAKQMNFVNKVTGMYIQKVIG